MLCVNHHSELGAVILGMVVKQKQEAKHQECQQREEKRSRFEALILQCRSAWTISNRPGRSWEKYSLGSYSNSKGMRSHMKFLTN
ncbi:hypothetical protein MA16_Dca016069 [Dendrobium catenatum]|uniref:Uncharacterized protein n=1 Tax=Dendrobium catenatum TaxID=906689 RepID=A0A2I0VET3_9ASPA|nr:hypothetical protein MA16_Dca016069 [Dendrobium catenatum]